MKEQYLMLRLDQERAIAALPKLLPADSAERDGAVGVIRHIVSVAGAPVGEIKARLDRIEALFTNGRAPSGESARGAPVGMKTTEPRLTKSQRTRSGAINLTRQEARKARF